MVQLKVWKDTMKFADRRHHGDMADKYHIVTTCFTTMFHVISGFASHCAPFDHCDMPTAGGLKQIVAEEGARGLYRGLGPQFVALLPNWAVRHSLVL